MQLRDKWGLLLFFLIFLVVWALSSIFDPAFSQALIEARYGNCELYSYKDYKMSGQQHIRSRQELAEGHGQQAEILRQVFGQVVTEPDYCYIAFNLRLPADSVLYVPSGAGNFSLQTMDGVIPDEGVFVQLNNGGRFISTQSTVGPEASSLFVNPEKVMLNRSDEPRVIIRFPKQVKLERIIGMTFEGRVRLIPEKR